PSLERSFEPDGRNHAVVPQAVVVEAVDAVREDHYLTPDDAAHAEAEVVEVLAPEIDAEQGLQRGARGGQVEKVGVVGGGAALELAAAEEAEREPDAASDVTIDPDAVACVALGNVVGAQVQAEVGMRLDPAPEDRREVEKGRGLERPGALEVVFVAGREAKVETGGRAEEVPARELV